MVALFYFVRLHTDAKLHCKYIILLRPTASRLPSNTDEARHATYERARTALRETLRNYDPPLSETELANEDAALDAAITKVEVDFLFSDIPRLVREEAAPSPPSLSLIPRVKQFVRSMVDKFKMRHHANL
jgi:hypothetical protein